MTKPRYTISAEYEAILDKYKDEYPVPLVRIAKDLGIKIFETFDLQKEQAGLIRKEGDQYVIYLNYNDKPERKRFTIAHEIGHFLLHKAELDKEGFADNIKQPIMHRNTHPDHELDQTEKEKEIEANTFAAELLMPEDKFKEIFSKNNSMETIADYFAVSTSAATIRAKDLLGLLII